MPAPRTGDADGAELARELVIESGIGGVAKSAPDAVAMVTPNRSTTYAELDGRHRRLAGALVDAGLTTGDRIAVWSSTRPESLEVTTGALRAGIIPVPVNALLTEPEAEYLLEDSGARWLFTDRQGEAPFSVEAVVTFGDAYERLLHEAAPMDIADHARGRPMHYTSGTTGRSKGVWVAPVGPNRAARLSEDFRSFWGLAGDDVHLVVSPLAHSAPHRYAMRTLEAGGTVVLLQRFDAEEVLASIELFGVTTTFMVPTHLRRILELPYRTLRRYDPSSMRLLVHAGAPIDEETKRKTLDLFPAGSVWEFYGSTEGHATRISPDEWSRKRGSVGTPRRGARIEITNEEGRPLGPNQIGDIWVSDPRGERFEYWGDPAKTRAAWRGDSFSVGDMGWLDEDGYLFLSGRKHDTIITGGVNVYPQEIERVFLEHPSVAEIVVYGGPDEEWGQEVRALVVPAFGQPLDPDRLRAWGRERLAGFKVPRTIEIVTELPRGPTGKIVRPRPHDDG